MEIATAFIEMISPLRIHSPFHPTLLYLLRHDVGELIQEKKFKIKMVKSYGVGDVTPHSESN